MPAAKIAYIDIETAPSLGYVWGIWETNVIDLKSNWYILSFAVKWGDSKTIKTYALPDYARFKTNKEDDKHLVQDLWKVLDEADVVIAHNGDRFDLRKANARFVAHRMKPPSPYKTVDTLKLSRRWFKFDSNRLNDLGKYLKVGRKLPHTGAHLWFGCMRGEAKSWRIMRKYNAQDVALLERVYHKLKPWATTHPNLTHFTRAAACPTCESARVVYTGYRYTQTGKRQRMHCLDCGAWASTGPLISYSKSKN